MKDRVKRTRGEAVKIDDCKYQTRLYILPKISCDLLPVWWKYRQHSTHTQTIGTRDRMSYAFKWLFFEFHAESVRMKRKQ